MRQKKGKIGIKFGVPISKRLEKGYRVLVWKKGKSFIQQNVT